MDTTTPYKFELDDAEGNSHAYQGLYIPGDVGLELSFEICQMLGEPIMRAFGSAAEGDEDAEVKDIDFAEAFEALQKISPKRVLSLAKRLLKQVTRGGKMLNEKGFRDAYRANYAEVYRALWAVVEANNLIPLGDMFSGISDLKVTEESTTESPDEPLE